jgi:hypothetical protein
MLLAQLQLQDIAKAARSSSASSVSFSELLGIWIRHAYSQGVQRPYMTTRVDGLRDDAITQARPGALVIVTPASVVDKQGRRAWI